MRKVSAPLALLCAAAFLSPLIGGYIEENIQPIVGSIKLTGIEASTLAHAILGLLIALPLCFALLKKQVIQVPQPRITVLLVIFFTLLGFSVTLSSYRFQSLLTFSEWVLYGSTLASVVAIAGRAYGPKALCSAFVGGNVVAALFGLVEYVTQPDPTWRIFGNWIDPNAFAGMLLMGYFVAVALAFCTGRRSPLFLLASAPIGAALLLTGSKGGLVGASVGFLALFLMVGGYAKRSAGKRLGLMIASLAVAAVFVVGAYTLQKRFSKQPAPPTSIAVASSPAPVPSTSGAVSAASPAPLNRLLNASATSEQSAAFRLNLWKGCVALIKDQWIGWGLGTYRFESARPGITTQTQLAHDSFLQLSVESSPAAGLMLIVLLLLVLIEIFRGSRRLPENQNLLRAGVFAALLAATCHNLFDSDLYIMGSGLAFFLLLGIAIQLSADAIVPEILPAAAKWTGAGISAVAALFLLYAGTVQLKLEQYMTSLSNPSPESPVDPASIEKTGAGLDYRGPLLASYARQNTNDMERDLKASLALGPTEAAFRQLARIYMSRNQNSEAQATLKQALKFDPNNLLVLGLLLQVDEKQFPDEATQVAQQLLEVEKKPYFTIRPLPDLIPTQTYDARLYLASLAKDAKTQVELLRPAVEGYLSYAQRTATQIKKMSDSGFPNSPYGRLEDAKKVIERAVAAADQLKNAYAQLADPKGAQWAGEEAPSTLKSVLADLNSPSLSK